MEAFRQSLLRTEGERDWRYLMHFEDGLALRPVDLHDHLQLMRGLYTDTGAPFPVPKGLAPESGLLSMEGLCVRGLSLVAAAAMCIPSFAPLFELLPLNNPLLPPLFPFDGRLACTAGAKLGRRLCPPTGGRADACAIPRRQTGFAASAARLLASALSARAAQ